MNYFSLLSCLDSACLVQCTTRPLFFLIKQLVLAFRSHLELGGLLLTRCMLALCTCTVWLPARVRFGSLHCGSLAASMCAVWLQAHVQFGSLHSCSLAACNDAGWLHAFMVVGVLGTSRGFFDVTFLSELVVGM